jgi:hypothetical protein
MGINSSIVAELRFKQKHFEFLSKKVNLIQLTMGKAEDKLSIIC